MSVDPYTQLIALTAPNGSAADRHLIPYFPGKTRIMPPNPNDPDGSSFEGDHALWPYVLVIPPPSQMARNTPDPVDTAYNSRRRLEVPKLNRIGLLIDIYA